MNSVPHSARPNAYEYGGLIAALILTLVLWFALWIGNGYFSAAFLHAYAVPWGYGALAHLIVSTIEHHLWRARDYVDDTDWRVMRWGVYGMILLVGTYDVGTSFVGVLGAAESRGIGTSVSIQAVAFVAAFGIAIAPEPLMILTWRAIRRVVWG